MSSARHPVALGLERRIDDTTRLLAVVMCLPLVDGLFPALVLAGALDTVTGIVEVGLLVFGGSATVAVIIADMERGPRSQAAVVLLVGAVLVPLAVLEAALAPSIAALIDLAVFERFAAVVILAVAARTASARVGELLPRPAVIVALGLVASVSPSEASLAVRLQPDLMVRALAAGSIGVAFALVVALTSPWLRNAFDLDRFRFGSAVALGVLPLSVFGLVPANVPLSLVVLAVTAVLAFDPDRAREREREYRPDDIDVTAAFSTGGRASRAVERRIEEEEYDEDRLPWL